MNNQTANQQQDPTDAILTFALVAIFGTMAFLTAMVYLLTLPHGGPGLPFNEIAGSLPKLVANRAEPAAAFPAPTSERLPGAVIYWGAHIVLFAATVFVAAKAWRIVRPNPNGLDQRERLGVLAQPTFATRKDLKGEFIKKPSPGRFVYGRYGRHVLATQHHQVYGRKRSVPGAVLLIGPSRCGKSFSAIDSIRAWDGPAIICSVKTDLINPTMAERSQQGEVQIYDPAGLTATPSASWTPLRAIVTFEDSMRSANRLLTSVQVDRSGSGKFWSNAGETLLAGFLWLAAKTPGLTMTDVARWVIGMDQPTADDPGKVATYLRAIATEEGLDPELIADVSSILGGVWRADDRMGSSYYHSARQAVMPWTRSGVRAISKTTTLDLDWLANGDNTVYIAAPLRDQEGLAPALGALISDLVDQVITRVDEQRQMLSKPILLLIDETANIPLVDLPKWASTLAGYGIQLVTAWQSKAQIDSKYGPDADTVIANHRTKVFFPGISDESTINYVAQVLGIEHQPNYVNGQPRMFDQSTRDSASGVPLVPANVLRQLGQDDRLLITGNLPPAHIKAIRRLPKRWLPIKRND